MSEPAFYRCICQDVGVVGMTEGEFDVGHGPRHHRVIATVEAPVFVRCHRCNPVQPESSKRRRTGEFA